MWPSGRLGWDQGDHPVGHLCAGCGAELPPSKGGRARKWCSEKCRKGSYGDPCVDCGKRTSYGAEHARVPEPRCPACATEAYRTWTREGIISAIQRWTEEHGEPPAVADWDPYIAGEQLHDDQRAHRAKLGIGTWPSPHTVRRAFGSWPAGLTAAGFDPRAPHGGAGNQWRRRNTTKPVAA